MVSGARRAVRDPRPEAVGRVERSIRCINSELLEPDIVDRPVVRTRQKWLEDELIASCATPVLTLVCKHIWRIGKVLRIAKAV